MVRHFLQIVLMVLGTLQLCLQQVYGNEHIYNRQPAPVYIPPGQGVESSITPAVYYALEESSNVQPKTSLVPVRKQDIDGEGDNDGGAVGGAQDRIIGTGVALQLFVGFPLFLLAGTAALTLGGFAIAAVLGIGFLVVSVIVVGAIGLFAGTLAFVVISGATIGALLSSGVMGLISILGIGRRTCPYQKLITPCTCSAAPNAAGVNAATINCPSSLSTTALHAIFNRIPSRYDIDAVNINFQPGFDANVPANLFGSVAVRSINLIGSNLGLVPIAIDPLGFRASRNKATTLTIQYFDLAAINWNFLTDFNALTTISIVNSNNVNQPPVLPALPNLNQFLINNVNKFPFPAGRSLKSARSLPLLSRGLAQLVLNHSKLSDEDASVYLNWALPTSKNTLKELILDYNSMTKIPNEISSFTSLNVVSMKGGDPAKGIFKVTKNSFDFKNPVKWLDLSESKIHTIEPGSFKGDFKKASVIFAGNQLTSFEEAVFRGLLEQMSVTNDSSVAFIDVAKNPFDCEKNPCHLAWILRDNRDFLKFVKNAACSNGSTFENLESGNFRDCPVKSLSRNHLLARRRRG